MVAVLKPLSDWSPAADVALSDLDSGRSARVQCVLGTESGSSPELTLRLADLGFLPGESVRIIRRGFLPGGPLAVRIGTGTFALRRYEAAVIRVIPEPDART